MVITNNYEEYKELSIVQNSLFRVIDQTELSESMISWHFKREHFEELITFDILSDSQFREALRKSKN
jgi:hypothetical protein